MNGRKEQELLGILAREAETAEAAIRTLFLFIERVVGLGLTLMGLGAAVGLAQDAKDVLVAAFRCDLRSWLRACTLERKNV
jgi:hypothetical protein